MKGHIVTANRLRDGLVVFFGVGSDWSTRMEGAAVASDDDADELLAAAGVAEGTAGVVEPYLVEVVLENGTAHPVRTREAIRASGPPAREDLGSQANRN